MDKAQAAFKKLSALAKDEEMAVGGATALTGGALIKRNIQRGHLTGRETLYHATGKQNVRSILDKGILASKSSAPGTITANVLSDIPFEKRKGLVYLGRKKSVATGVGRTQNLKEMISSQPRTQFVNIKGNVPVWKLKTTENPELLGAKNRSEFVKRHAAKYKDTVRLIPPKLEAHMAYGTLSSKGTTVIKGDVESKYLKGSANYTKNSISEIKEFIKTNPKRFGKGVAGIAAGLALAGFGASKLINTKQNG